MIYVVSKTRHAPMWRRLRTHGVPIISTWIDEAKVGESKSARDLWTRIFNEVRQAQLLVGYVKPGDELKGGLAEIGAGLISHKRVLMAGLPEAILGCGLKTLRYHPQITEFTYLGSAIDEAMNNLGVR